MQLEQAIDQVQANWFPVNGETLDQIKSEFQAKTYAKDREKLLDDLKSDFALFLYAIRELIRATEDLSPSSASQPHDPISLLRSTPLEDIEGIINRADNSVGTHRAKDLTEPQSLRLQHSLLSATVTETLAEKISVSPEIGYTTALMRQLGLTLITWNYPHIYERALNSLSAKDNNLDRVLHSILGFSPTLLGIRIARRWNLSTEILVAMGDRKANQEQEQLAYDSEALAKICEVGEALARANDPKHYPTARGDWEKAQKEIVRHLGPQGIKKIQSRIQENCGQYSESIGQLLEVTLHANQKGSLQSSKSGMELLEKNPYIQLCPAVLQQQLRELYLEITPGQISRDCINRLVREVCPAAGFDAGCIYMVEPVSMVLAPMLKFGNFNAERIKELKLAAFGLSDPILTAFECNSPIKQDDLHNDGTRYSFICGTIGASHKAGVLYLEIAERVTTKTNFDPIVHFKAVRHALNDCLGMR
ncbi:MAG: HDOD domain-containing protein [Bdellovibrionales bacterium]|nr:HDOD domain-containing protein [Bdellovibrionales bacterium]